MRSFRDHREVNESVARACERPERSGGREEHARGSRWPRSEAEGASDEAGEA
ncbi:hypothetical protein PM085_16650 [Halorubrum ezzemoulense]|uniref:Uncharacterized protein n=1 Tax=Halorubrum ezzemoulense TaxID=337243 RepID=A0ABT4Z6Q7_HALEZ|nr:hypothetical protein [Halorubrum ezzemoulense]MDB2293874.1 hypothetical protein [Halorubrum ezzemoulense]